MTIYQILLVEGNNRIVVEEHHTILLACMRLVQLNESLEDEDFHYSLDLKVGA